jgi:hypothetical protein
MTGCPLGFGLQASPDVHAARIEPDKERLLVAVGAVDEIRRGFEEFLVDRFHALLGKRPGVLAFLLSPCPETWIVAWRLGRSRNTFQDAAWTKLRPERGIFRIIFVFRFILRIEVVEVAEELIETM